MTYHIYSPWKFDDPIEDCPIKGIAETIKIHGYHPPIAYTILSQSDSFVFNISLLLRTNKGKMIDRNLIENSLPESDEKGHAPDGTRDKIIKIIEKILTELDLMDKVCDIF